MIFNISLSPHTAITLLCFLILAIPFLVPTKAPQNLSALLKNKSSVILKWNHLSSNDVVRDLLGYSVIVTDMRSVKVFNETLQSNQSQIEVSTLKPNLLYDLKVSGCTKTGCGKESSLRFFTADGECYWQANTLALLTRYWVPPNGPNNYVK